MEVYHGPSNFPDPNGYQSLVEWVESDNGSRLTRGQVGQARDGDQLSQMRDYCRLSL